MSFVQAVVNGVAIGSMLALAALAFSAVFVIRRYLNFAVGVLATIGAYVGLQVATLTDLPMIVPVLAGFFVAGALGFAGDRFAIAPLSKGGSLTMAIATLALAIVFENVVRFFFGNDPRVYPVPLARDIVVGGIHFGAQQIKNLGFVLVTLTALWLILTRTKEGRAVRAIAENEDLARLRGIEPARIKGMAVFVTTGVCGMAGVMFGLDSAVDPMLGTRLQLSIFAAAVLGGLGSLQGAVIGALLIGIIEELTATFLDPTYRLAVGFLVIFLVLAIFPRGLLGRQA